MDLEVLNEINNLANKYNAQLLPVIKDKKYEDIKRVYNNHGRFQTTNVLSASLRDVRQVEQSFLMGADVCTIPPIVFWKMYKNILTDKGLELFQADWDDVNK